MNEGRGTSPFNLVVSYFCLLRESLAPLLVDMVRSSYTLLDPANLPAILQKDAVYAAVGHAAFDLYDEIDFDAWLTSSLGQELDVKVILYPTICESCVGTNK